MKNLLLLIALLFGFQFMQAQYVTIPDTLFRAKLKALYPTCFNVNDMMDTTCSAIVNATQLGAYNNNNIASLEGIQYFKHLKILGCNDNKLTAFPPLPATLEQLVCYHNLFTSLPPLPPNLKYLDCGFNQLSALPALPDSLISLDCSRNPLTMLPSLPPFLLTLICYNFPSAGLLTSLPSFPESLTVLDCSQNELTSLPAFPPHLRQLACANNHLKVLPPFPSLLYNIGCAGNLLTALPELPVSLHYLDCSYNHLTALPAMHDSLSSLYCNNNQLTSLPELPNSLYDIRAGNNYLTSLPAIPAYLRTLLIPYNQLSALPSLPSFLQVLGSNNNPLNCLPFLPASLTALYVKHTNISCKPNALTPGATMDTILPVCSNPDNICAVNPFVTGKIYLDADNSNTFTTGDSLLSQQMIKVSPNNWLAASEENGQYIVKLDTVITNTWSAVNNYRYATITPVSYSLGNIHTLGLAGENYDFSVHFIPGVRDLEMMLESTRARPGFITTVTLTVNNVGTVDQSGITVKLKKPNGFNVFLASVTPSAVINDTLIWNNISIGLLNSKSLYISFEVPANTLIGSYAVYDAWADGIQGDSTPFDNSAYWIEMIRGAVDPNEKIVNRDLLLEGYNPEVERLLYTIRFQNTGTDTAFTVIVRDVIPANLDIASLRVVNSSAPCQLIVREKNIVEIAFPNIQLPDSNSNESGSHGFVQLSFKPKGGLTSGTSINNNASILFDYNLPVKTDTATTRVEFVLGIPDNKDVAFQLFPNPASESITVKLPYTRTGKWFLRDVSGRTIQGNDIDNKISFDVDVTAVPAGMYFLTLEMNGAISSARVVIAR